MGSTAHALIVSVAPKRLEKASLSSITSTATMGYASTIAAAWIAQSPMPPTPNTATDCPGFTPSVLIMAPAPVITAQPITQVRSVGTSLGIGNTTRSDPRAYSAQVEAEPETSFPRHLNVDCGRSFKA